MVQFGLDERIAVVTGGSKGIGRACAEAFLAAGARVVVISRSQQNLEAALAALSSGRRDQVTAIAADLTSAAESDRVVAQIEADVGPVDILVNSAGAARRYAPAELDAKAWHDAMQAKYFSYIHPMQALLPRMASRASGTVVNIIGMGGKVASPTHLPGGAANSALMLATVGLAKAYGPSGIRINGINPGLTLTSRIEQSLETEAQMIGLAKDEMVAKAQAEIPLRRFGTPEEVARVALFLASDLASYVTGAIVPMDGGLSCVF